MDAMKMRKWFLMILALALVLLIVIAGVLYNSLSEKAAPDRLAPPAETTAPTPPAETVAPTETAAPTPTAEPEAPAETAPAQDAGATDAPQSEPAHIPMPDFTVYDREGNEVHLSDFAGKPVIINCWASWCDPCKIEMPGFEEAWSEYGDDIHFVMLNMTTSFGESYMSAASYIGRQGYKFPVYYDKDGSVEQIYGVHSYPITLFLDAHGCGVTYAIGAIDRETLQIGIDILLPEGPQKRPEGLFLRSFGAFFIVFQFSPGSFSEEPATTVTA